MQNEIIMLIDRSGSMGNKKDEVDGGFIGFVDEQKANNPKAKLTLTQFDTEIEELYKSAALSKVEFKCQPRGMTALFDALGKTVTDAHVRFKKRKVYPNVILVVITDGQENSSREFTKETVKVLLDEMKKDFNWDDLFIGAQFDNFDDAHGLGYAQGATVSANNLRGAFYQSSTYTSDTQVHGVERLGRKAQWKGLINKEKSE